MEPHTVPATRLDEDICALDIGLEERDGVGDRVVVMGLGGKVHHGIGLGNQPIHKRSIADVANHQLNAVDRQVGNVPMIARVGELVQHDHMHARVLAHDMAHKIRTDETTPTGNEDATRPETQSFHEGLQSSQP